MKPSFAGVNIVHCALLLCVIVAQLSAAQPQISAADHLRRGVELDEKEDLDGAITEF